MSEAIRTYTGSLRANAGQSRRWGLLGYFMPAVTLPAGALLLFYIFWAGRDSAPVYRFIPQDAAFTVIVHDPLGQKERLAASPIWDLAPEENWGLDEIGAALRKDPGLPEWIIRHLVGRTITVAGKDAHSISSAVIYTKMSRLGVVLARGAALTKGVSRDPAGGLKLGRIPAARLYFATRGRTLMLSPDRRALIESLTLPDEEATPQDTYERLMSGGGPESIHGAWNSPGGALEDLEFDITLRENGGEINVRGKPGEAWKPRLAPLLEGTAPMPLRIPPDGAVQISLNFGKPLRETAIAISEAFDSPALGRETWEKWLEPPADNVPPPPASAIAALLAPLGPGAQLAFRGFDVNEIVPAPRLVLGFDGAPEILEAALEALPPDEGPTLDLPFAPRYDKAGERMVVRLPGGDSLEPSAAPHSAGLLLASGPRELRDAANGWDATRMAPAAGAVYVRIEPGPLVGSLAEAGQLLADTGLVAGHDSGSFREAAARWRQRAAAVEELTGFAAVENGTITLRATLRVAPTGGT